MAFYGNCARLQCYHPTPPNNYPELVSLSLDGAAVSVRIVDVHAQVLLSQKFKNSFKSAVEASYTFPILGKTAVCGFRMIRGDGTVVDGHVLEKKEAKQKYDEAVAEGKTASLGEEQTKDLFNITVGNILPSETVTIEISFVTELTDDEKRDQVRFVFPRAYATRYGEAPTPQAASVGSGRQLFSIDVAIQQAASIKSVSCPSSHPIELSLGKPDDIVDASLPDSNFASVKLSTGDTLLEQDFILVVTAAGLDSPRCFVETHPSPNQLTTAIGLTFVPRFNVPDVEGGMEYVFLVDRSGSMDGSPMKLTQEALVVLLRGLPSKGTKFNIFSFGSKHDSLWPKSKEYTQATLDEATKHIDRMSADYGGTEIASALQSVFKSLPSQRTQPANVFLLTDGGAWDVSTCAEYTRTALASPGPFIRVFSIGIGNGVSTDTCDGIARAGEGIAVYVAENEPMTGKCARLVRAARTSPVKDLKVLWPGTSSSGSGQHDDFEMVDAPEKKAADLPEYEAVASPPSVNLFDDSADTKTDDATGPPPKPKVEVPPIPTIQQAPAKIPGLFPGTRTQICAIISSAGLSKGNMPPTIKVEGTLATTGAKVELDIPISKAIATKDDSKSAGKLLHTLAARALITDYEDGKHSFPASITSKFASDSQLEPAYIEAEIVRLGTTYQLTSKHTSFIAIDEVNVDQKIVAPTITPMLYGGAPQVHRMKMYSISSGGGGGGGAVGYSAAVPMMENSATPMMAMMAAPPPPGAMAQSASFGTMQKSVKSRSAHNPFAGGAARLGAKIFGGPGPKMKKAQAVDAARISSFEVDEENDEDDAEVENEETEQSIESKSSTARLTSVARLQQFDGHFDLSSNLLLLLGIKAKSVEAIKKELAAGGQAAVEDKVVATVLAMQWMEKVAKDEAEDMILKAKDWVEGELAGKEDIESVKQRVQQAAE